MEEFGEFGEFGEYWDPYAGGHLGGGSSRGDDGGRFWEDRERRGMGGLVSSLASMSLSRSTLGSSGGKLSAGGAGMLSNGGAGGMGSGSGRWGFGGGGGAE